MLNTLILVFVRINKTITSIMQFGKKNLYSSEAKNKIKMHNGKPNLLGFHIDCVWAKIISIQYPEQTPK